MFPVSQYLQNSRSSSFLIRDILGTEAALANADKYAAFEQTLGSGPTSLYSGAGFPATQGLGYYPTSLPYQDFRRGYSIDNILETGSSKESTVSVPIPLPVYIRTRSPLGSDVYGKPKRCRRSRTVFTDLQLMGLEKKFETQKYLSTPDRMDAADTLGLTQLQVKTWYQNRRMKWKKQVLQAGSKESPTKPKGRPPKSDTNLESPTPENSSIPRAALFTDRTCIDNNDTCTTSRAINQDTCHVTKSNDDYEALFSMNSSAVSNIS